MSTLSSEQQSQRQEQAVKLWAVGIFCIFCWDYLTCVPKEIRYIWRRKFTLVSLLYVANRYFGLVQGAVAIWVMGLSNTSRTCGKMFLWRPVGSIILTLLSHALMAGRVYAVYGLSKIVIGVLVTVMAAEFAIQAYTLTTIFPTPPRAESTFSVPCAVNGPFRWVIAFWTIPLLFDTVALILVLFKTLSYFLRREIRNPTITLIFHNGLVYFATLFFMNLANVIVLVTQDAGLQSINLPATTLLNVIMSCRMVLNIRDEHTRTHTIGTSVSLADAERQVSGWESPTQRERDTYKLSNIRGQSSIPPAQHQHIN